MKCLGTICITKMRGSILLSFLLLWAQDIVRCIHLKELRVPAHVAVGDSALFGCQFDLEHDLLYSVKWYKDGKEFFRYLPKNPPDLMWFERPGVNVDISRSSSDVVTLTNLQPESAGVYRCEVTGEAPVFALATDEKYVTVHVLPKEGPKITGLKYEYEIGDRLSANCTSSGSRPEAIIKWLVNNKPVHRAHLRGPWHRVVQDPPDTTETTLGLYFMVLPSHYRDDIMQIKCQATIAPLYQREQVFLLNPPDPDNLEETSLQPLIPSIESIEKDTLTLNERVIPDKIDEVRKMMGTIHLEPPVKYTPITTEAPGNATGYATLMLMSLEIMVISLLMSVILS